MKRANGEHLDDLAAQKLSGRIVLEGAASRHEVVFFGCEFVQ
jgi:hypothetical protein